MTEQSLQTPYTSSALTSLAEQREEKERQKRLISWVNEQFTRSKEARWKAERQWYLNMAFYFGQQNVQFKGTGSSLDRSMQLTVPPAPYYKARPVINKIRPLLRTEMSKLTAQKPNAFIVPASSDDRDMYAANAGEQIWDSIYRDKKYHSKLRRSVFWACITGNGFIKSYWDEEVHDPLSDQPGDICFSSITPFHIFVPDLKEEDIEDQPWVIHAQLRNAEELSNFYKRPVNFERAAGDLLEDSFINVMGIQQWEKNKNVLVLECWVRPGVCKEIPEGGMYVIAGNQVIYGSNGWPYEHNKYPFAHVGHVQSGKFYRDSVITDLIPLQKEYNRTRGQIIEAKNRMAKPQLAAEMGSLDPSKITSEPGQVILYRPGFQAPQPIPLQGIPSYVLDELERIKQDMDEISGQHEVSRGQTPPGVTAATAISYLQEQDETKLSFTYDSIEEATEKVAFMSLSYVKQFWDEERQVKVTGLDGSFDVMAFRGSDLRGNTDIRVEAGSALPTSKAAKQAFIMDLMKMGFIDPQKGLEVMEIGGINKIYEQVQTDVRQAQRENLRMAQATEEIVAQDKQMKEDEWLASPEGQDAVTNGALVTNPQTGQRLLVQPPDPNTPPEPGTDPSQPIVSEIPVPLIVPVNSWDDHRVHIERHNNYRKSQSFEQLEKGAKDLFEAHVQAHISAIVQGALGALPPELATPEIAQEASQPEAYKEGQQQTYPSVPEDQL
jgi:hypothetical protein